MRSKEDQSPASERGTPAQRFGAYMTEAATAAGLDVREGKGGRSRLAEQTGMSLSAVGRMLTGRTLPQPRHFTALARAVKRNPRDLFDIAGLETGRDSTDDRIRPVGSVPLTPEEVADMWEISDPALRQLFVSTSEQVRRLQREADQRESAGGAVARG
jgi:transcriptional regulator with XRE-family HTH domain